MPATPDWVLSLYTSNQKPYTQHLYSTTARQFVADPLLQTVAASFTREAPLLEPVFHVDNTIK